MILSEKENSLMYQGKVEGNILCYVIALNIISFIQFNNKFGGLISVVEVFGAMQ